ncbi:hypothetical protein AGLY_014337 [Aphis glycines]|uniref:Uncharacterized protein n=1 Tax=Aphis glycines TaxID=307491 RepID=A0A6G0T3W9_APHGL|nr:hypothetical protein AGLY_014337 [Aphis glycines]
MKWLVGESEVKNNEIVDFSNQYLTLAVIRSRLFNTFWNDLTAQPVAGTIPAVPLTIATTEFGYYLVSRRVRNTFLKRLSAKPYQYSHTVLAGRFSVNDSIDTTKMDSVTDSVLNNIRCKSVSPSTFTRYCINLSVYSRIIRVRIRLILIVSVIVGASNVIRLLSDYVCVVSPQMRHIVLDILLSMCQLKIERSCTNLEERKSSLTVQVGFYILSL